MGSLSLLAPELVAQRGKRQRRRLPATRANASMQPVLVPGDAVFRLTESTVRHFGTPSPNAASRIEC